MKRAYIAFGLDQQGGVLPTFVRRVEPAPAAATRRIEWLESDTCPGELDTPESVYQRDLESNGWTGTDFAIVVVAFVLFVILLAHFATQIARAIPT